MQVANLKSDALNTAKQIQALQHRAKRLNDADYIEYVDGLLPVLLYGIGGFCDDCRRQYLPYIRQHNAINARALQQMQQIRFDYSDGHRSSGGNFRQRPPSPAAQELLVQVSTERQQAARRLGVLQLALLPELHNFEWRYPPKEFIVARDKGAPMSAEERVDYFAYATSAGTAGRPGRGRDFLEFIPLDALSPLPAAAVTPAPAGQEASSGPGAGFQSPSRQPAFKGMFD